MRLGADALRKIFADDSYGWTAHMGERQLFARDLRIGSYSIDVTLGNHLLVPKYLTDVVDPMSDRLQIEYQRLDLPDLLPPGVPALGYVRERFDCSQPVIVEGQSRHFISQIDGRSTVGRLFLLVHVTAGCSDFGFAGCYTLELVNLSPVPIRLHPGMRIAQVSFVPVVSPGQHVGAYDPDTHVDRPVPPLLGRHRFA